MRPGDVRGLSADRPDFENEKTLDCIGGVRSVRCFPKSLCVYVSQTYHTHTYKG